MAEFTAGKSLNAFKGPSVPNLDASVFITGAEMLAWSKMRNVIGNETHMVENLTNPFLNKWDRIGL